MLSMFQTVVPPFSGDGIGFGMNSVDSKIFLEMLSKFSNSIAGSMKCSNASKQVSNSIGLCSDLSNSNPLQKYFLSVCPANEN